MKKGLAITVISILAIAAIAMGVLYYTNNEQKTTEINALVDVVSEKNGEIETLNTDVADKSDKINLLTADINSKAQTIETLTSDVSDKMNQIDALTDDVAEKNSQIEALTNDVAEKSSEIDAMSVEITAKNNELDTLSATVIDRDSKIESLNNSLADKDTQIETLNATITERDKKIKDLDITIKEQAAKLDYANMSEESLNNVVQQITPPLEQLGYSVLVRNYGQTVKPVDSAASTTEEQFLSDLVKALEDRWLLNDNAPSTAMTDKQQIEYYQALVNAELNYLSKYNDLPFEDHILEEYAHTYITALQDQLVGITEYYGKDDATYDQYWGNAYYTRAQTLYWINRKYGITVSEKNKGTLNDMFEIGHYVDHYKAVGNCIKSQLEEIELGVSDRNDYSITVQAPAIKNTTAYSIESLSVKILLYDANNNLIDTGYLSSSSSISSGAMTDLGSSYISKHFDHYALSYEYYVSGSVSGQYYYEGFSGIATPKEQFGWNGAIIKNGEFAAGQAIYTLENVVNGWDYNKSWGKTLYVPYLKFSVKNMGDKAGDKVTIKVSFINQSQNEIWNEQTDYLIGSSDAPLEPGYSKKAFIYSSVGYEGVPPILPSLTAEIYINNILIDTIEINK